MRALFCATCLSWLCLTSTSEAELIANWNFNSYDGDAHTIAADRSFAPGASMEIDASWPSTDLSASTGTTENAFGGDAAGSAVQFANSANNGKGLTMAFSMDGWYDPVLSFAGRRTGNGFDTNQLLYSTDGVSFTQFGADFDVVQGVNYQTFSFDLSTVNALDNVSTAYLRIQWDGAANSSGTSGIDNVQIHAVPEPHGLALIGLASFGFITIRRRRSQTQKAAA
ncbi:MAG: PEP-CTERM sorting domain-containing protein [Planctomycetaceae bacterium]|nr:PEP-CTERM sorting domain-containing protein [Planctomycetaceae bacterium]